MKKKKFLFIIIAGFLTGSTCDVPSVEDKAETAAAEMCECYKTKSLNTCKEQLDKKYGQYANNDTFIKAFNNAQDCGITVSKQK